MPGVGGCFLPGGVLPGGVHLSQGGATIVGNASFQRGVLPSWGVLPSQHALNADRPTVNRITHTSNILTLATTSLRPVMKYSHTNQMMHMFSQIPEYLVSSASLSTDPRAGTL